MYIRRTLKRKKIMKKISEKHLSNIEIDKDKNGFTVWITETTNGNKTRYWLVDGSCLLEDGEISIRAAHPNKYRATYDNDNERIIIVER